MMGQVFYILQVSQKNIAWKNDSWQYECKKCGKQTTWRSETAMHGSQLLF